ncbi:MAG TPA: AIR carboxylase family protein [Anaerolineales bacterium]|nr:AIR carboxylase family protein [Anaerolineales bacterium]
MSKPLAITLFGSPSDKDHVSKIVAALDQFGIENALHIASAHKTPRQLLDLLDQYEADPRPKVYITVAGRSNALSGMVDAAVTAPVIACPPTGSNFGGADIYSSLRMPSGVSPLVVLEPENAALAAAKIFGLVAPEIAAEVRAYQESYQKRLEEADVRLTEYRESRIEDS